MLHAFSPKKHETQLKYHLVTDKPPFTVKTIDWMHQTGPRILLSVTHMLYVNEICHGVSRCVKDGSCSSSSLSEIQRTIVMRYLTISTNVDAIKHITVLLSGRQRTGALCVQHSPTPAAFSTPFLLNHGTQQSCGLNALIAWFRESYSIVSVSRESKRLKKSSSDWLNSGNALQHFSEKCNFRVSSFAR